jgi:hypothetical protein
MGKAMIDLATSKGKRKAPKSSDVKEKKARQTPAKPAKSQSQSEAKSWSHEAEDGG